MAQWGVPLLVAAAALAAGCQGAPARVEPAEDIARPDFRGVVKHAADRVFPAVVYIKCIRETHEAGKKTSEEVSGSGVLISASGEVLTNWHVVDKAVEVRCLLYDGRAMEARVVGTDKDTDLALAALKVPPGQTVPFATLGDSDAVREGDFVMAMGAPWGLSRSVSIGIISCTRRFLPDHSEYSLWLQTDASISPGNSGGPLVNTDGEVVGLNTRAVMFGGDMGFAIPSNTIRYLVAQIRQAGRVDWAWTGLQLQPLKDFNRNTYFDGTQGVIVAETDPESPARRAGILARDRLLEVGGARLNALTEEDLPAVRRHLGLLAKHQGVEVLLLRDGQARRFSLTPREKGKVEGAELDCPRWDFTVKQINQFDNPDLFFHRQEGVFIYGVKDPGNADNAGLRAKDIILRLGGREVVTLDDVKRVHAEALKNLRQQHRVMVTVLRNGLMREVVLDFSRDYEKE
jgi:serine protease Do